MQVQRVLPLLAVLVLVIVGGIWYIQSCQADAQKSAYRHYVDNVNAVAQRSNAIGEALDSTLYAADASPAAVETAVTRLQARQQVVQETTAALSDTGKLNGLQRYLLLSMQYRTEGLKELRAALAKAFSGSAVTADGDRAVATAYGWFLASDYVYQYSFQSPANAALPHNVGSSIGASVFGRSPDDAGPKSVDSMLTRIKGGAGGGGNATCTGHVGTALDKVVAVIPPTGSGTTPTFKRLIPSKVIDVPARKGLRYQVTFENSGECQVTHVKVHFSEQGVTAGATQSVAALDQGQVAQIYFTPTTPGLGSGAQQITVTVERQPRETTISNNTATYKVQYVLNS